MKKFLFAAMALLLLAACENNPLGYTIHGEVEGTQSGLVYLKSFRNKMFFTVDSTEIRDGKFEFKGSVGAPELYGLQTEDMNYPAQFFLEDAPIRVKLDSEHTKIWVENSPVNDIFAENAEKVYQPGYNIDSLVSKYPNSPVSAFYLYRYHTYQMPLDELKATRAKLSPTLNNTAYVADLDQIIERLENVQIGKMAPEFTLPDPDGNPVSISDFRGQYVLLDFWAAWCPPCRRENPNIVKAFQEYKDKNFTIVGVSLDYNRNNWLKAIEDDNLTWTHVSDLKFWDSEVPELYGVRAIPDNFLLDPEGKIIGRNITGEKLHETLAEIFNK
ncbi:MAG: AhpC/TSA family protein [Tannerellaceae bacterium]|nr:AhpC/TSA family protein [Tannerellaceae bacterium]